MASVVRMSHRIGGSFHGACQDGGIRYNWPQIRSQAGWTLGLHVISMAIRSCQSIRISNGDSLAILCGSCIVHNMDTKYTIEYGFYPIDGTTWSVVRHTAVPGGLGIAVTVARFRTKEHAEAFLATL